MALAHDPELDAQLYTLAFDAEPALDTLPSLSGARLLIAANDESLDPIVRQRAAILYLQRRADAQAGLVKSSPEDYERDHPFSELSRRELMLLSAAVLLKPLDFTLPDHDLRYAAGWQLLLTIFNPANGDVDFVKSAQRLFTKNAIDYQTRRNTGQLPLTDFPPPESTPMLLDSPIPSPPSDYEQSQLASRTPSLGPACAVEDQPEKTSAHTTPPTSHRLPSPLYESTSMQDMFVLLDEHQEVDPMRDAGFDWAPANSSESPAQGSENPQTAGGPTEAASLSQAFTSESGRGTEEEITSTGSDDIAAPSALTMSLPRSGRAADGATLSADYTLIPDDGLNIVSAKGVEFTVDNFGARVSSANQALLAFKAEDVVRASCEYNCSATADASRVADSMTTGRRVRRDDRQSDALHASARARLRSNGRPRQNRDRM